MNQRATLLAIQTAALAQAPHVQGGDVEEEQATAGLIATAKQLGATIDENVRHVIRYCLTTGKAAMPAERTPAQVNGHAHVRAPADMGPEPPTAGPADYGLEEMPTEAGDQSALRSAQNFSRVEAKPYEWREPEQIKRRAWLYGRHYIRGYVSATIGRPGLGKSALGITETLDMVSARKILDQQDRDLLRVWYIGEDPREEIERRIAAACTYFRLTPEDVVGRLFFNSTLDLPALRIAQQGLRGPIVNDAAVAALAAQIRANSIDVLILDPLIKFHALPESDSMAMETVLRPLAELAGDTNIAIDTPHHTRKQPAGVTAPATIDDARGASSIAGAVRCARVLNPMTQAEADRVGIAAGDRWRYLRIDDAKGNMKPPEAAQWLQHASEILPCGESVGVVAPWQFPDAFAGFSANDLPRIRELARTGAYRSDSRSPDWFGHAVADMLGLDLDDKREKARVKQMVKTWINNKVLDIETRDDEQRRPREFIVPGSYTTFAEAAE